MPMGADDRMQPSAGEDRTPARPADRAPRAGGWPYALALAALVIGLVVTAALALISLALYHDNEKRLLGLRARDAAAVLTAAVPSIQTPLASAAELAEATNGDVAKFRAFVTPFVGTGSGREFESVSLWRAGGSRAPITTVGPAPMLMTTTRARSFIARASRSGQLSVTGLLTPPAFGLGYAYAAPQATHGFVVYAESPLPANRRVPSQGNAAFSDINYAIYLGRSQRPSRLLLTSVSHLPLSGRTSALTVPFGSNALTLVVAARHPLGGTLPQRLPWIIAIVGGLLSLAASAVALGLIRRRRAAERLALRLDRIARENRRLYAEQRDIAQTLQHALLPEAMPRIPGAEASARYQAGERGVEIGGDWYDVIEVDDHRVLLVVGDVSGHGLRAAATMAALRYAIHAYAMEGNSPSEILTKLSRLIDVAAGGQLATVLCVAVDIAAHEVSITSAGHLPPLLLTDGDGRYLNGEVGLPVGIDRAATYKTVTAATAPGATLLAFTDGLIERRGEHLDEGLNRLREVARTNHSSLDELLARVLAEVRAEPAEDDTAIVGLRWLG